LSTTLSTNAMIAKLQQKYSIGIGTVQWTDFLNEAFRKLNQMSKGGFIWNLKTTTLAIPAGGPTAVALPVDFDAGKSAFLYGATTITPTSTLIPYKPVEEWVNEQHFQTTAIGMFSSWTFYPNFTLGPPTTYGFVLRLAPLTAFPLGGGGVSLPFFYHAVNMPAFTAAANVYFPTPDQFDSFIMDLAEAEARRVYGGAGWDKLAAGATQSINEIIDTYRTDRYDLAGISDVVAQAQEKAAERDR
jgi:hypothetical protein